MLEDVPSISQPYNTQFSTIDDKSIYLYYTICWILPFLLLLLALVIFLSCRPHIHKLLEQHSRGKNFNQLFCTASNWIGFLYFCDYIYVMDLLGDTQAIVIDLECLINIYVSNKSAKYSKATVRIITIIDSSALLCSFINLILVSSSSICNGNKCCWKFITCYSYLFHGLWLCKKYATVKCENLKNKAKESLKAYNEAKLWLLFVSFTAPVVCIGTHSSFVIMAWSSDSTQASSMIIIFIISFLYYFLGFRQFYVMFVTSKCKCVHYKKVCSIVQDKRSIVY